MKGTIRQLLIYPIKGLTPHPCQSVTLVVNHGIKGDRAFALLFDEGQLKNIEMTQVPWMKKQNFAVQNDWPQLAALDCHFQAETQELSIKYLNRELMRVNLKRLEDRERISDFFTGYLAALTPTKTARHPQKSPLKLVGSWEQNTRYPDRHQGHLSLISQATLDDLRDRVQQPVNLHRFRPNIVLEGLLPWQEFELVGQQLNLGAAKIEITARINRCNNIEVNPETGCQDLPLLSVLKESQGHQQTGVLAQVIQSGTVQLGSIMDSV